MKKFLVIYRMDMAKMREMMATTSKAEQDKGMQEWGAWMEANKSSFADSGAPAGKNTSVSTGGAEEHSNDVGGYSIMQGESKEAVIEVLKKSPHLMMPGATCDVMELMSM